MIMPGGDWRRRATDRGTFSTQVKRAIERGNIDGAKIHAQDAIRKKNEGLNMLRLASRLMVVTLPGERGR